MNLKNAAKTARTICASAHRFPARQVKIVARLFIVGTAESISLCSSLLKTRCNMQNPESKKLLDHLPDWNKKLHQKNAFGNDTFKRYLSYFDWLLGPRKQDIKVLDFGCGSNGGIASYGFNAIPYDPFVEQFSDDPWHKDFQAVFSADVLEHMTVSQSVDLLHKLLSDKVKYVFLAVATRSANQVFENGINAHLTVENGDWWLGLCQAVLSKKMTCVIALDDMVTDNVVLGFVENEEAKIRGFDTQNSFLGQVGSDAH